MGSPRQQSTRDAMADGISIRVRVRRATSTSRLEQYGEPQDMVCTIVNWDVSSSGGGTRRKAGSPRRGRNNSNNISNNNTFANQFRSNSSSKADPVPYGTNGKVTPTLFFQTRTYSGHTLEACCSLHSVSSYDSLDPSIVSESIVEQQVEETTSPAVVSVRPNNSSATRVSFKTQDEHHKQRKCTYAVPCSAIKTVEKVSSLFRGYRIFFATGSRGSYELEFENKNGMDIMIAFLQATLPPERFVNFASASLDGEDTASHMSFLDVEKLEKLTMGERQNSETMSERLRKGVGHMVSSIEEMSNSFCGNVCCSSPFTGASVAPYVSADEIRDSPPPKSKCCITNTGSGTGTGGSIKTKFPEPVMEIDETSMQSSKVMNMEEQMDKRLYLKDYKLPSGLSMEELEELPE